MTEVIFNLGAIGRVDEPTARLVVDALGARADQLLHAGAQAARDLLAEREAKGTSISSASVRLTEHMAEAGRLQTLADTLFTAIRTTHTTETAPDPPPATTTTGTPPPEPVLGADPDPVVDAAISDLLARQAENEDVMTPADFDPTTGQAVGPEAQATLDNLRANADKIPQVAVNADEELDPQLLADSVGAPDPGDDRPLDVEATPAELGLPDAPVED